MPSRKTARVGTTSRAERQSPRARSAMVTAFGGTAARVMASQTSRTRVAPSRPAPTAPRAKLYCRMRKRAVTPRWAAAR